MQDPIEGQITEAPGFSHEALFYSGDRGFLEGTVPFLREGIAAGEPILVAVSADRIALLRHHLGADAAHIRFVDMAELGGNPARIIPTWEEFASTAGPRARGIGEPAWPGRTEAEFDECDLHESLLNLAFAEATGFRLLCPYDIEALDERVVAAARRNHPLISHSGDALAPSGAYVPPHEGVGPFAGELPAPAGEIASLAFEGDHLGELRRFVWEHARAAELSPQRQADLVLAINELAGNSVRHGGGAGVVRAWREPGALLLEVADSGRVDDPLLGRRRPDAIQLSGRGVWIVNQLCDLVQIRSGPEGTLVRVRMDLG